MSLFLRLFTYRPRVGRITKEDFFTEAFVGVLQANDELSKGFVNWLIYPQEVDSAHIATQKTLSSGDRIDIWIEALSDCRRNRHVIAIENKIDADVDKDQLDRYKSQLQLETTANTRTLVCATRYERASLEPSPAVAFRQICWHEVADWLKKWRIQQREQQYEPGGTLVYELLSLMEDWKMEIHLTADDLSATTRHRTSVEGHLIQLLNEVWAECELPQGQGQWSYDKRNLGYASKQFTKDMKAWAEFGFDFERNDTDWSVPQLGLPSAYFAVKGTEGPELKNRLDALAWSPAPKDWGSNYLRAKQLNSLNVTGFSLHPIYLNFFKTARRELWRALRL